MNPTSRAADFGHDANDQAIDSISAEFERRWRAGERPLIESLLGAASEGQQAALIRRLVELEIGLRRAAGENLDPFEYAARFPRHRDLIERLFGGADSNNQSLVSTAVFPHSPVTLTTPELMQVTLAPPVTGRYQTKELLGAGGFGQVWRAYDPDLDRDVAIKIPRPDRQHRVDMLNRILAEARKVSRIDCAGVVRVHDVGTDAGQFFIVSELLEGGTLAKRMDAARLSFNETAELMTIVADAVHVAHLAGLTHRDLKPSNILLDLKGRPKVADFGLAVSEEEQLAEQPSSVGTLAYMSPEQARGESHRVNARSDVYSLGVILYQMLCGRLPFPAKATASYRDQILHSEPRPPRTIDDAIPRELERICLKCLAKPIAERYTTAADLAGDLRAWVASVETGRAPEKSPNRSWAVTVALVAALSLLTVYVATHFHRSTADAPQLSNPVQKQWAEVFGQTPDFLAFPGFRGDGTLEWSRTKQALAVQSTDIRLIKLGEADGRDFRIGVSLQQPIWEGDVGIFLGWHPENVSGEASSAFHLVCLARMATLDGRFEYRIRRWNAYVQPRTGTLHAKVAIAKDGVERPSVPPLPRLEIEVRKNRLRSVRWCGRELTPLTSDGAEAASGAVDLAGPFGLYTTSGATWFADPVFEILSGAEK